MFTVKEIAEMLKVNPMTIFRALNNGKIKGVKFGGIWRVSEEEVERLKREGF